MTQKQKIKQKEQEIIDLAQKLCREKINEEYAGLAEKLVKKLGRKREAPFVRGRSEIWATAVVHALGTINFLFDRSFLPYISFDALCAFYGTGKSTIGAKSAQVRELAHVDYFNDEFKTASMKGDDLFGKLKTTDDGFLYLDDEEEEVEEMMLEDLTPFLDKAAIFVKPKQPLIDWVNSLDPENPMQLEDFFDGNTYLVDDEDDFIIEPADIDLFVEKHHVEIFENELLELWTDTGDWPETISFVMFKEWFEYHVSTMVFNLG